MLYRHAHKSDRFLRVIEDYWKDTPVKAMSVGAIRQTAFTLYPTAGPATRNRQVIVPTQAIINHAAEQELCPRIRVRRFPVVRREKEPATWEWIQAFMAAAIKPNTAALACFMFLTGARVSEAMAATWDDVDFAAKRVLIKQTKIGNERRAHMPPELVVALANIDGSRDGKVFGFKSRGNCRTQWAGAIRRAGIKPLSYHACRHGFATGLLGAGVNPMDVAKRGGWKSAQHVFATYGHATEDETVVERLTGTPATQKSRKYNGVK
jgi:integrase